MSTVLRQRRRHIIRLSLAVCIALGLLWAALAHPAAQAGVIINDGPQAGVIIQGGPQASIINDDPVAGIIMPGSPQASIIVHDGPAVDYWPL
jgi:uncharacterized protein involved in exopolysaccharide biosynthesis